jgi:16S rRNA (cytidine1402-2'-O)-methyltransferase
MEQKGTLYVVATPIGNLEDITLRALRILKEVDYILCEDTRVTGKLLAHYEVEKTMHRYDAHSSPKQQSLILKDLEDGKSIALLSDAGTPGVSDPGVHIIDQIYAKKVDAVVVAVPGASAVTAAFSISGIVGNQFTFLGFVPHKKGRVSFFDTVSTAVLPVIFLESTHRILKTLESLSVTCPHKTVVVAREMTKLHEEVVRDTPANALAYLEAHSVKQKGEFVLIAF